METTRDLSRFIVAQQRDYQTALAEIQNGRKMSHWMWYIFPQIQGLGKSLTSQYYAIQDIDEARDFLKNSYLRNNLVQICQALLLLQTNNATEVFGKPDDMKLRSSMTLFACASEGDSVFTQVLIKFFDGKPDNRTKKLLGM